MGVSRNTCYSLPWRIKQVMAHLDCRVLIKAWETMSRVKAMTDSVWSELIHNLSVPVVFFQITVIWRETHYSECVNGFFFSSHPLYERQQLDDLSSKRSVSTGGLFQLNFAHNTYFVFAREIPGSILDSHHLLSCLINHKLFFFIRRPIFNFHFLTNQIFMSSTCTHSTLNILATGHFKNLNSYRIVTITNAEFFGATMWKETKRRPQREKFEVFGQCHLNAALRSFTFCTWCVPASHFYFISPDS